ncbi:MAG: ammonia-forming cytochrome c nitrite reductase subunit c552 [Candidatus Acidiferrum sp.]
MSRAFLHGILGLLLALAASQPARGQSEEGYAGAEACAKCHAGIHHEWQESSHSRIMQPATDASVKGDFAQKGKVILRGTTYVLQYRDHHYYIAEPDLSGKLWEHRIEYTLGTRRFQEYLTTLPDGRIVVLPPAWDITRKKWEFDLDTGNPEEGSGDPIQVWNKTCYSCHVSQGQKNFDVEKLRYQTTWQNLGINCESCHGPGKQHIARATDVKVLDPATRARIRAAIVDPARLDPVRSTMICAQCHSLRDIYADNFHAGANYYDYFTPVMQYRLPSSEDSPYWPDGRPRQLANEAFGLWQSQCFLKGGATCSTCHSHPHDPDVGRNPLLRPTNSNALCTGCHGTIAANVSAHTHHPSKSSGSFCIECHMPAVVTSLKTRMRDHSISIPVPENTIRHGIPNACNVCHRDKDAEWTLRQMNAWYGDKSRQKFIRRADAFAQARQGEAAAIPALEDILSDSSGGPLIRANAAGYLGNFSEAPSAYDSLLRSFADPEPLVRATAATAIRPSAAQREALATELVGLLKDPILTVRMNAAIAMVAMGVRPFEGEDGERYERAKELYHARAELDSDDAQQQLAAGKFSFLSGDMAGAVTAFGAALKLDPSVLAQYYLARSLAEKGDYQSARQILNAIPHDDRQYDSAQRLLAEIEAKDAKNTETQPGSMSSPEATSAQAQFLNGQVLYQSQQYGAAMKDFEQALRVAPQAEWATKAQIYRAICLEKLARTSEAEAAMQALLEQPEARQDVELQLAFIELLFETGRTPEALKKVDGLIEADPKAAMAYYWRARVLLQLERTAEAATAAEEAIGLLPQFPEAHNLLLKIYLMQGRAKEAKQQAEWLQEYERHKESH